MPLVSLAKNPVPGGAVDGFVVADDGLKLRFARWEATRAPLRGTVVVVPGRSEFIEKYFEVVADLRRRGFAVVVYDLRGQGGSDRELADPGKGHVSSFKAYERDLDTIFRDVAAAYCPAPYVALGHSLGGNILLKAATREGTPFERMVLSAPMIRIAQTQLGMTQRLARGACEMLTLFGAGHRFTPGGHGYRTEPFEGNMLTSDRERFLRAQAVLEAAPQMAIGSPTNGWLRAAFRAMAFLQAPDTPRAVRVPILFVAAGEDRIVSTTAIEEFALRTKLGSRVLIPGSRHEILQETNDIRARFWSAFDAYLAAAQAAA